MNELAVISEAEKNDLLSVLIGTQDEEPIKVDFIKICHTGVDKQDREIKRGLFSLSNQEDPVWTDKATIHVLAQYFQFREQDETGKVLNKSLLQPDLRKGEPLDMKGGLRCGKPTRKALNQLPEQDQKMWAARVKTVRIIRGIISYKGKTADGTEVEVNNVPFQHYMKGMGYNDFEKVIDSLPFGKRYVDFHCAVTTERRGNYYYTTFKPDFSSPAAFTTPVAETTKLFIDMAKQENNAIMRRHNEAKMEEASIGEVYDAVSGDDLDTDF